MIRLLCLFILTAAAFAQPMPDTVWSRLLQEDGSIRLIDLSTNAQGNVFVAGALVDDSIGITDDPLIYKLSPAGVPQWQYRYANPMRNYVYNVLPAPDGGCWFAGINQSDANLESDIYIRELSATGQLEWTNPIDLGLGYEYGAALAAAPNDGFYVVGATSTYDWLNPGIFITRFEADRDTIWTHVELFDYGPALTNAVAAGGGVAVAGTHGFFEVYFPFVFLVDANGDLVWHTEFPTTGYSAVTGLDYDETSEVVYLCVVDYLSFPNPYTVYKIGLDGTDLGSVVLQYPSSDQDTVFTLYGMKLLHEQITLGGLISYGNPPSVSFPCVTQTDPQGIPQWTIPFTGTPDVATYFEFKLDRMIESSYVFATSYQLSWNDPVAILIYRTGSEIAGELVGVVRDGSNLQPIPGVSVRTLPDSVQTVTQTDGSYRLVLRPGVYTLIYEQNGYCADTIAGIVIEDHLPTTQNVTLSSPDFEQSVTSISLIWTGTEIISPFAISNPAGACPLSYETIEPVEWMYVEPANGTIEPGSSREVRVHVTGPFPVSGDNLSSITITHNAGEPAHIPVTVFNTLDADDPAPVPAVTLLHGAYPNPFNARAAISFSLARDADVRLTVHDLLGREVALLHAGRLQAGTHTRALNGESLATGVYFARLSGPGIEQSTKLLLLK